MFSSTVLEVAVGLVFCYASVALIASSVYEAIASMFKLRANCLLEGVKALLNDQQFVGLAKDLYNHALINPQASGQARSEQQLTVKPSYIDPKLFATALIDSIQRGPATFAELGEKINAIEDAQIRELFKTLYARADGKLENLQAAVATWFDAGMSRVSGVYKRNAQAFSFVIAFATAGLFNIDSFHLFSTLWSHPALVSQLAMPTAQTPAQALEGLKALPVGWVTFPPSSFLPVLGWLATASSALFGAPFWFDLLQRITNLRGTGPKPNEK